MLLPEHNECPSSIAVQKDDCAAAGKAVGGVLLSDNRVNEENLFTQPSGCSLGPGLIVSYNESPTGANNGLWHSICHKLKVRLKLLCLALFTPNISFFVQSCR